MTGQSQETGDHRRPRRDGFALIEVMIGGVILVIGSMGFAGLLTASNQTGRSNREAAISVEAARRVVESLEAFTPHSDLFALHNDNPDDDPVAATPIKGFSLNHFEVPGLDFVHDDPDGLVGELIFPINPVTGAIHPDLQAADVIASRALLERAASGQGASPADLLPVIVRLRWASPKGVREHEVRTLLSAR